jgi:O-antigen/teichoic acid export membrane protein
VKDKDLAEKIAKSYVDEAEGKLKYLPIVLSIVAAVLTVVALLSKDAVPLALWPALLFFLVLMIVLGIAWWWYNQKLIKAYDKYRRKQLELVDNNTSNVDDDCLEENNNTSA